MPPRVPAVVKIKQRLAVLGIEYEELFENTDAGRQCARVERHLLSAFSMLLRPHPDQLSSVAIYLMSRIMRIQGMVQARMGTMSNSAQRTRKLQQGVLDRALRKQNGPVRKRRTRKAKK
jgi:hypothetical protein